MSYAHALPHNLKSVLARHDISLIFTAPNKLGRLCVRSDPERRRKGRFVRNHVNRYVDCQVVVVYEIPPSYDISYVGQARRRVDERLRELFSSLLATLSGNLAIHRSRCACVPCIKFVSLLARVGDGACRDLPHPKSSL